MRSPVACSPRKPRAEALEVGEDLVAHAEDEALRGADEQEAAEHREHAADGGEDEPLDRRGPDRGHRVAHGRAVDDAGEHRDDDGVAGRRGGHREEGEDELRAVGAGVRPEPAEDLPQCHAPGRPGRRPCSATPRSAPSRPSGTERRRRGPGRGPWRPRRHCSRSPGASSRPTGDIPSTSVECAPTVSPRTTRALRTRRCPARRRRPCVGRAAAGRASAVSRPGQTPGRTGGPGGGRAARPEPVTVTSQSSQQDFGLQCLGSQLSCFGGQHWWHLQPRWWWCLWRGGVKCSRRPKWPIGWFLSGEGNNPRRVARRRSRWGHNLRITCE